MPLKRSLHFIAPLLFLFLTACATSSELNAVRSEVNQQMEANLAALDARIDKLQKEQVKSAETLASMRKGQANAGADLVELREQIQQLRGQVEILKKDLARDTKKEEDYREKIDGILLKIGFIENFLEIGKKDYAGDADSSDLPRDASGKQDKAAQYAAAYSTFKAGNYAKAREAFQTFLAAHPTGEYADNAQFWIGECYFFEKKYDKAILEYEKVTKKFPNSNKVPYALLKQGLAFQNLGDKVSAKLLLQQVIRDYPNTSQARIARSKLQEIK